MLDSTVENGPRTTQRAKRSLDSLAILSSNEPRLGPKYDKRLLTGNHRSGIPSAVDKTSRIISSYRVLDVLGRGAMGIVYRAEHVSTGELVALKTIGGTTVRILASIRREIMALSRIRHRGIARIVDHGDHDGVPWYAMELLQGRTLRDVIAQQFGAKRSTSGAEAAAPLLDVVHRVCEPLAHLHSHGIIHRDLKPENIYVREDGSVVLVDFGIAVHFGDSREYELGESVLELTGTPEYMAPEQILGRAVDARADLYSLGCILYECLTGRTPFSSLTLGAVVSRQLSARPPPPSQLVPELLPGLDELVSHLLQKRPVDRLGYAEDVAGRLVALGVENEAPASSKARAYVYRPEFVGRTELIERLRRTIRGEATGPRRLLIAGESGVGKTRLLFELATYAAFQDFVVVTAQCVGDRSLGGVRAGIAAPLQPFRSFLERVADACHEGGAPVSERLLGGRVGVLSAYEARIKEVPALKDEPPPVALAPEAAREKVFDSLRETLFAFANGRPLLVVVDDLQWADELTLGFIESLSSDMLEARDCYVVGSYRSEDEDARLRQLAGCADFEKIELSRLGPEAVAEMIAGSEGRGAVSGEASPAFRSQAKKAQGTSSTAPRLREGCHPAARRSRPSWRRFPKRTAKLSGSGSARAAPTLPNRSGSRSVRVPPGPWLTKSVAGPRHPPLEMRREVEIHAPSGRRPMTVSPPSEGTGAAASPGRRNVLV